VTKRASRKREVEEGMLTGHWDREIGGLSGGVGDWNRDKEVKIMRGYKGEQK
jgi:hypothetical protein